MNLGAVVGGGICVHMVVTMILFSGFGISSGDLPLYCQLPPAILGMFLGAWVSRDKKKEE